VSDDINFKDLFAIIVEIKKKPITENSGFVKCPCCESIIAWSRAPSNGHTRGKCQTPDCIEWIE